MTDVLTIVLGTKSRSKIAAIKALLRDLPVELLSGEEALGDALPNVVEDAETFEDNAIKKAHAIADVALMITLADDQGLEVKALGGRPGVRSARFAREGATDAENNAELLKRMEEIEDDQRHARFRHAIALVDPWDPGSEVVVAGSLEGKIARSPSGAGGFGYDALFVLDGQQRTLAEIDEDERRTISHSSKALAALEPILTALVKKRLANASSIVRGSYLPPPSRKREH